MSALSPFLPLNSFPPGPKGVENAAGFKKRFLNSLSLAALGFLLHTPVLADSFHVDNVLGNDTHDGSATSPVKTIQKGIDLAQPGDTVFLRVNAEPYSEPNINFKRGGAPGVPITLDGQGAVLSGLIPYGPDQWKEVGNGVYGAPFHFPLRFKQVSATKDYKQSGFSFIFFDGKAGVCADSLEALQPGEYFLSMETADAGGTLYIKLAPGKTPANTTILMPRPKHTALHVGRNHITVKNITSAWASQDGFSTTKSHNLIFENVRGCYNMDQGMSHHGSQVITRHSLFDHNAATGVRDVYEDCDSDYDDCVFWENLVAGMDAMGRRHRIARCLFLDNYGSGISISKDATAEVEGSGFKGEERSGLRGWKCAFTVKNSTFDHLKVGISVAESKATFAGNALLGCGSNYEWSFQEGWKGALGNLKMDGNLFVGGDFQPSQKERNLSFADFVSLTGRESTSRSLPIGDAGSYSSAGLVKHEGKTYGAGIPLTLPEKYRKLPSPDLRIVLPSPLPQSPTSNPARP